MVVVVVVVVVVEVVGLVVVVVVVVVVTGVIFCLGSDRVVDLKFGSGDAVCHIILELYASGNVVLLDGNYQIIALLRSHKFEEDIAVQVGEIYPIKFTTTVSTSTITSTPTITSTTAYGTSSANITASSGSVAGGGSSDVNSTTTSATDRSGSGSGSVATMTTSEFVQWTRERYQEMVTQNEEQQKLKIENDKVVAVNSAPTKGKLR